MGDDRAVTDCSNDLKALRDGLLMRRRALSFRDVARNSSLVVERLRGLPELVGATNIGAYVGVRGEIDPSELLTGLDEKQIALPITTPGEPLRFMIPDGELVDGPFGIRQPHRGLEVSPRDLDVVIVPLVAVDVQGNRIGHGGGYYDRTFSGVVRRHSSVSESEERKCQAPVPLLIGLCHEFQVVSAIDPRPWDVPLHLVVTEVGLVRP